MCGIAGFIGCVSEEEAPGILNGFGKALHHRGPDHQGSYFERLSPSRALGFSQALLSIIGLPGEGVQPFRVEGGVLAFNGAIYNFSALREELKKRGREFRTQTDTEVLAVGLATEGISFLEKTRGMFAFAFWNEKTKKLWLGRDPYGVKPLYVARTPTSLLFASEYKAILPHVRHAELDEAAVFDYLRLRYVPGRATLFRDVRKVPPGTVMEIAALSMDTHEVTYFHEVAGDHAPNGDELFSLIEQAISRRAVADTEVAALLSGGIDSGLVCDILERSVKQLHTYTLGFPGHVSDESARASRISELLGTRNTIIPDAPSDIEQLSRVTYHLDDPYGDPIILALDRIFSFISGKQRVVVTGEGADEIFSGYVHHRVMGISERVPKSLMSMGAGFAGIFPHSLLHQLFPYAGKLSADDYRRALARLSRYAEKRSLAAFETIFFLFDDDDFTQSSLTNLRFGSETRPGLREVREWDIANWLPNSQLFKLDKIAMAWSIEAREPFVDSDLIQAVKQIPVRNHVHFTGDKPVLRAAVQGKVRLPAEVVSGRKSSFFQPFTADQQSGLREQIRERLEGNRRFLERFLRREVVERTIRAAGAGLLSQKQLFALGALTLWQERMLSLVGTGKKIHEA
jgi:asparagine synthase (glutamine-hydrolysing)